MPGLSQMIACTVMFSFCTSEELMACGASERPHGYVDGQCVMNNSPILISSLNTIWLHTDGISYLVTQGRCFIGSLWDNVMSLVCEEMSWQMYRRVMHSV